jgi:hypothetical protein
MVDVRRGVHGLAESLGGETSAIAHLGDDLLGASLEDTEDQLVAGYCDRHQQVHWCPFCAHRRHAFTEPRDDVVESFLGQRGPIPLDEVTLSVRDRRCHRCDARCEELSQNQVFPYVSVWPMWRPSSAREWIPSLR